MVEDAQMFQNGNLEDTMHSRRFKENGKMAEYQDMSLNPKFISNKQLRDLSGINATKSKKLMNGAVKTLQSSPKVKQVEQVQMQVETAHQELLKARDML